VLSIKTFFIITAVVLGSLKLLFVIRALIGLKTKRSQQGLFYNHGGRARVD